MEGVDCAERAILPKKLLREQLQQFIENDFSMSTQVKTLKDFKQHTGENECVNATIGILEFTNKLKEVPKVYKTHYCISFQALLYFFSSFMVSFHSFSGSGASGQKTSKEGARRGASLLCLRQLLR